MFSSRCLGLIPIAFILLAAALLATAKTPLSNKRDVQGELLIGILSDNPDLVRSALVRGARIDVCPEMLPPAPGPDVVPTTEHVGFNKGINAHQGYNLLYWAAAFGTERVKQALRDLGWNIPSDDSAPVREKALLARFELRHLKYTYDVLSIFEPSTGRGPPPDALLRKYHARVFRLWLRGFKFSSLPSTETRLIESGFRDPFGNEVGLLPYEDGPKVSDKSVLESASAIGESSEAFWGSLLPTKLVDAKK